MLYICSVNRHKQVRKKPKQQHKLETSNMKKLEKKINFLISIIELGTLTRKEALYEIRSLKAELDQMFEPGSDKHQTLLYSLIDAHNLTVDTLI